MDFAGLAVSPPLLAALARQKITVPTAIQVAALPLLAEGKDATLEAETGTGKTLAYLLPLLPRLDAALAATQLLVLAPTHELALQIQRQCCDLVQAAGWTLRTVLLIGGTAMERQKEKLKKKPQIVIGTPGRVLDWGRAGTLKIDRLRALVIDEADQMLGGEPQAMVRTIVSAAPKQRQLVFVSATSNPESAAAIAELAPGHVAVRTAEVAVNSAIEHGYLVGESRDKPDLLRKLLHALQPERALVFVHTQEGAEEVAAKLEYHKIAVADLHGAFGKAERKQAMDDFRRGTARVLIASDVAARGLDLPGVTHVINLDVPTLSKAYLHRVGRTGRAGAKGTAISLMSASETRLITRWERELAITVRQLRLREGKLTVVDALAESPPATKAGP